MKEQGTAVVKAGQNKANEALKTVSNVVNSPEATIAGKLAGPKVDEKIKQGQNVVNGALQNPTIVGENNANNNK